MLISINLQNFNLITIIDILLVGLIVYYIYRLLKGSVAINIFLGIIIIFTIWKITQLAGLRLLSSILGQFTGMGFLAIVIVFQQEIRRFLLALGSTNIFKNSHLLQKISFLNKSKITSNIKKNSEILVSACKKMGSERTGALILLERNQSLEFVKISGDSMNIELNQPILESIFYKNSPLHDGAIVIQDGYIVATRVILPVVTQNSIPKQYGLRHRAAISITEKTDAIALVVSEETGKTSYIKNGDFISYSSENELFKKLGEDLSK
ncbi:MAG: diadenylate cyclase [Capnocytophaga sp.]|nr:diadenylate cyclase [Capnocytophaga sp.]